MRALVAVSLIAVMFSGCAALGDGAEQGIDQDRDGMADAYEAQLGLDPHSADTDGDGVRDIEEIVAASDPWSAGPLGHTTLPFDLGQHVVQGGGQARYVVHMHGEATFPDGEGPYPLVVLMHGRHGTCAIGGSEILLQPCPDAGPVAPVDSFEGYRYLAEHLAGHGMVVVSVDANNVNDHDNTWGRTLGMAGGDYGATARANILFQTIDAVADGSIGAWSAKADVDRIGIMGHSRGGEGVIRAMHLMQNDATRADYGIQAVMALAPTDFARWELEGGMDGDAPAGPAFATILPYCDGDVSNLQGVWAYDDMEGGDKHQFLHMGANHNYYNTVWTRTDFGDRGDPYCDEGASTSGRLSADEQRDGGLGIMAPFFRHYLQHDDTWAPLLSGTLRADPDVFVRHQAREETGIVIGVGDGLRAIRSGDVELTECRGDCPGQNTYGTSTQTIVEWTGAASLRSDDHIVPGRMLHVPVVAPMGTDPAALDGASLVFYDGTDVAWSSTLADLGVIVAPGDQYSKSILSDVVIAIPAGADSVALELSGSGGFQMGVWRSQPNPWL